jgi:hypothetical protein
MGRRSTIYICFGAILTCGGWMFAQVPSKTATENEAKTKLPADAKLGGDLEQFLKERGYTAIPLERCRIGYIVVVVSVGEKKLRLMCDTGAPYCTLDEKRTKELKIDWEKSEYDVPAGVAEGDLGKTCKIEVMELNAFKAHGIRFYNQDRTYTNKFLEQYKDLPIDGILGADVLKDYSGKIDYGALRLYLRARN